ncbi:MAG: hemolysin III family protein [[Lactobacillus] timonensis]|jgi:hemolysin III|nr:hemolysin III family protein [[Lactobacillus] timonensis]MCI2006132.1 hemolysin III family protein [[Lactobacillus] timonensis]
MMTRAEVEGGRKKISKTTLWIEIGNAISHGIGVGLSIAGLVLLIVKTVKSGGGPMRVTTFAIYGAIMVLFYLSSTLFHSLVFTRAAHVFQIFDHDMIYLLIAGSYTPFCLVAIGGWRGWTLFGIIWGLAVIGVVYKSIWLKKKSKWSTLLYVLMGWLCMTCAPQLWHSLGSTGFLLLLAGGITFSIGAVLYSFPTRYTHLIWHFFVLAGTALIYFSVLFFV